MFFKKIVRRWGNFVLCVCLCENHDSRQPFYFFLFIFHLYFYNFFFFCLAYLLLLLTSNQLRFLFFFIFVIVICGKSLILATSLLLWTTVTMATGWSFLYRSLLNRYLFKRAAHLYNLFIPVLLKRKKNRIKCLILKYFTFSCFLSCIHFYIFLYFYIFKFELIWYISKQVLEKAGEVWVNS